MNIKKNAVQFKQVSLSTLVILALVSLSNVSADPRNVNTSWYVGGSLGTSKLDPNENNTGWEITDKKDISKKVYVGKHINDQISLEAFWTDLGSAAARSTVSGGTGEINYRGYGANVVYNLPYQFGNFKPFGKLGVAKFTTKDKGDVKSSQMNSTSLVAGLGVDYEINDQLDIRTEFDYYDKDAHDLNVGLKWSPFYQAHNHNRVQAVKIAPQPKPIAPKVIYKKSPPKVVYVPKKVYVKPATPKAKPRYQVFKRNLSGGSNFDTASAQLTYQGENTLNRLVSDINAQRISLREIMVVGHTDSIGSHQSNHLLSVNRANSVASYLASRGIDRTLIRTLGRGETQPIADNRYKHGRAQNRRVEITINGTSTKLVRQ